VTHLANRPDSGGNGNWALDRFTRVATVTSKGSVAPSDCGVRSGPCYAYTASMKDVGKFTTILGAFTPNQGAPYTGMHITRRLTGQLRGYGQFTTFYATAKPNAHLVPHVVNGTPPGDASYTWPTLFFPAGTTVVGVSEETWGYVYTAHVRISHHRGTTQRWADTYNNGGGQLPADGNITG